MAEPCRIRPTEPADLGSLTLLEQAAFSDPWSSEMLREALDAAGAVSLIAEASSGAVIGSALARAAADEGEILSIAVDPAVRGQGVGRLLLAATLDLLVAAGATSVWLEVRPSNTAARALYRSAGFTAAGVRRRYYRRPQEDALVLTWRRPAADGAARQ
jgi:ribosomal-protein-alanine N-acetyltransferase